MQTTNLGGSIFDPGSGEQYTVPLSTNKKKRPVLIRRLLEQQLNERRYSDFKRSVTTASTKQQAGNVVRQLNAQIRECERLLKHTQKLKECDSCLDMQPKRPHLKQLTRRLLELARQINTL